jgi:hypothetical protein
VINRRYTRRGVTVVAGAAVACVVAAGAAQTAGAAGDPVATGKTSTDSPSGKVKKPKAHDKLGQHDRELLAKAVHKGDRRVTVMLATDHGSTAEVVKAVKAAGGFTGTVNDRVGYISATVPTGAVDRIAAQSKVLAVDLNESVPLPDRRALRDAAGTSTAAVTVAGPGASTPNSNPYMPTRDTGSVAFKTANPTWDGRGITVGILDSGVDLDSPALQTTSTGERKIVDWVTATDPIFDGDGTWRLMRTRVNATPTFSSANATWTAPFSGQFAFSRFNEAITTADEAGGDVNRDGDTTDLFGVLYEYSTNDIWVDVNQDRIFSASEKMRPYKENHQIGHFGTDNPATAVAESMPFTVEFREDVDLAPFGLHEVADYVNIGIVEAAHGTHVSGIAAGHSLFGGAMDGQAPGAKIVSSRACSWGGGCTAVALSDGMVDLVANRGVNVVNMSIGGLPALNDGNNARARLYDSLIDTYGVQIVISAGNSGPGVNTIGDPAVATKVISAASSITKDTWLFNYGSEVSSAMALHNFSSRGPREDGGFKPDVMAPGSAISSVPTWQLGQPVAEAGYSLPPGYAMLQGTSMASPQTAGSAALLLSAAKQRGVAVTPRQLRESIYSSATYFPNIEAVGQGNGLVNVPGAWASLQSSPATQDYTTDAPVCTPISGFLATPNRGPGVYNRCDAAHGGQVAGKAKPYGVIVTRTSGRPGDARHSIRLLGNDGTFTVAQSTTLARGVPTRINVVAKTSTPGWHSAVVLVDDPTTPLVDHRFMVAVVVSNDLAAPSFTQSTSGTVERNLFKRVLVTVPAGAKALQVDLSGYAANSHVRWIAINPYGLAVEATSSLVCYTNFSDPNACNPTSRAYANPLPGVWELEVEARRTSPLLVNPFTLTAVAQGVTVTPPSQTLASVQAGTPAPVSWTVTNDFGPVTIHPTGGPLGSALSERKTIANHETQDFTLVVPTGATKLTATIGSPSDLGADLDLFLIGPSGAIVAQSADGDSEESVTLTNPAAGEYKVEIDGFEVPSGSTQYNYFDVFFSPALGSLTVPAAAVTLARGASTTVNGQVTANAAPATGRQLFGQMQVRSDAGAVLGFGDVLIGSVTP